MNQDNRSRIKGHRGIWIWLGILLLFASGMILIEWMSEFSLAASTFAFVYNYSSAASSYELIDSNFANSTVLILMWTKWFGRPLYEGLVPECPRQNCIVTNNRSMLESSNAVVLHVRDIDWNDLPKKRRENQNFVFFNWESPYHTGGDFSSAWKKWYFNSTMTYRRNSEIYAPYGSIIRRRSRLRHDLGALAKKKTKSIAWLVSNCQTPGRREKLVENLRSHIQVDIFGGCGKLKCEKDKNNSDTNPKACGYIFEQNYKFFLAFENSLCKDYVTEKFFLRIQRYLVPVVLERRHYEKFCPDYKKAWFVAADDFKSAKELAAYLEHLAKNDTAYYEYLSWHEQYEATIHVNSDTGAVSNAHFCDLCNFEARRKGKLISKDVWNWWNSDACHTGNY